MSIDIAWVEEMLLGRKLTDAEAPALTKAVEVTTVPKGNKIIEQGQVGGALYFVRSGQAEVRFDGVSAIAMAALGEGAAVGEMSFLTQDPASASVVALSDCVTYRISRSAFTDLMASFPALTFSIFAYLLRHTAKVIRHMNDAHVSMFQYISGGRLGG